MSVLDAVRGHVDSYTAGERFAAILVGGFVAAVGLALVSGQLSGGYLLFLLGLAGMYVLLSLGLNVQWGYAGLVNFSVVAFWGIGAYSAALVTAPSAPIPLELHPVVGLLVAIVASATVALLIAVPTLRLRGDYLAIATLGFAEVIRLLMLNERWLTAGGLGIAGIPPILRGISEAIPQVRLNLGVARIELTHGLTNSLLEFLAVATLVLVVFLGLRRIQRSPWGRVLRTIRADEDLARALGKDTFRFKLQAFVLGSVIMAIAGVFYVHFNRYLDPSDLMAIETFYVWIAVILGGSGSNRGAILGGLSVIAILEGTRLVNALPLLAGVDIAPLRLFLIGLLVILVIRYKPEGLLPPQHEHIWPEATQEADR